MKREDAVQRLATALKVRRAELGFDTICAMLDAHTISQHQRETIAKKLVLLEACGIYSIPGVAALDDILAAYGLRIGYLVRMMLEPHEVMQLIAADERLAATMWQALVEQIEE